MAVLLVVIMGLTYILIFSVPFIFRYTLAVGEQFMFDPNIQFQPPFINAENARPIPGNQQFRSPSRNYMGVNPPIHHRSPVATEPQPPPSKENEKGRDAKNYTISDIVDAFSDVSSERQDESEDERAVARDFDISPYGYQPPSYGYPPRPYGYPPRPSYGPAYHEQSYAPAPPVHHHSASKISLLKPALDLVKPVTTKVAGKVSGLIGLVLALLTGSSPDDLELKGFKDIVINGIVKPLLLAKGGIKTLISKLTIPVIALLLINLEVLITVWWLWEDCPQAAPTPPPPYPYPRPSYNNYNTY